MLRRWALSYGLPLCGYFGYPLGRSMKVLRASQGWSAEEIRSYRDRALRELMRHCYAQVPYYRDVMTARGLRPDDFQAAGDLAKLPYLTRDIIRREGNRLRADNYPDRVCQFRRSGGTTGEPIRVGLDRKARAFEVAAYLRGFEWMKCRLGNPTVRLFGGSLGLSINPTLKTKLKERLLNNRFLPAFELTAENVEKYVDVIRRSAGGVLVGYASAVLNLAEYMSMRGIQGSPLRSVICTAEYMPDEWRTRISAALGVPVFCYYGCGEVTGVAHECAGEEGYLVAQEHVVLEAAAGAAAEFREEGFGEAAITPLFNYAMPLIRYLNGDVLELKYPSRGRPHLRIVKLHGRVVDQLWRRDGSKISGTLIPHMVFQSGCSAWKYQVVQTAYDTIRFHYLPSSNGNGLAPEMREMLVKIFRQHLGADTSVEFVTGGFELTKSGKHRVVINKVESHVAARGPVELAEAVQ